MKNIRLIFGILLLLLITTVSAEIVVKAKRTGANVAGPIPIPTRIERFCVLRSPHVDKKSREHFERRTHCRVIEIREIAREHQVPYVPRVKAPVRNAVRGRGVMEYRWRGADLCNGDPAHP